VGKRLAFGYTKAIKEGEGTTKPLTLRVVAVYDQSWQADGPQTAYLSEQTAARLAAARSLLPTDQYREADGASKATVLVARQSKVREVTAKLQALDFAASPVSDRVRNLPGLFGAADWASKGGAVLLVAVAVALGFARARDSVRARLSQFAVLRILGSAVRDLTGVLLGEALLTGLVAVAAGGLVGTLGAVALGRPLSSLLGLQINWPDLLPGIGWTVLALGSLMAGLAAGALLGGRLALRQDPYLVVRRQV
jgi:putative ABC transport system permease protein